MQRVPFEGKAGPGRGAKYTGWGEKRGGSPRKRERSRYKVPPAKRGCGPRKRDEKHYI